MLSNQTTASSIPTPILDRKIEETAADLPPAYTKKLYLIYSENKNNAKDIISYIAAMKNEINLATHYRRDLIEILTKFSKFKNKPFKDITRADVIEYLESYRRTDTTDPLHKWIGTYNLYRIHLMRFFKWFVLS